MACYAQFLQHLIRQPWNIGNSKRGYSLPNAPWFFVQCPGVYMPRSIPFVRHFDEALSLVSRTWDIFAGVFLSWSTMQYSLCFINFRNSFDSFSVTGSFTSTSLSRSTISLLLAFFNSSGVKRRPLRVSLLTLEWNKGRGLECSRYKHSYMALHCDLFLVKISFENPLAIVWTLQTSNNLYWPSIILTSWLPPGFQVSILPWVTSLQPSGETWHNLRYDVPPSCGTHNSYHFPTDM